MVKTHEKTRKMTVLALFSAIIVILQIISTFIRFGQINITLALTPIIIGAALYGWKSGALLGFVFGLITVIAGIFGWDGGAVLPLLSLNPIATVIFLLLKGILAGIIAGLAYKAIAKKNKTAAAFTAGALAPITNTGVYMIGMLTIFRDYLETMMQGVESTLPLAVLLFLGIAVNFSVELIVNLALGSAITRIIDGISRKKSK